MAREQAKATDASSLQQQLPAHPEVASADGNAGASDSALLRQFVHPEEPTRVSSMTSFDPLPDKPAPTLPDSFIEGYRLEEELHRGGQGIVYKATQLSTKRVVALKVLLEGPLAADMARRRFEREIELAASLQHPNIVTILESGQSGGRYYFAMEYVDGQRLDRYFAQNRPPLEQVLEVLAKVCDAVNYAHQRGVIHRDLKPSNILVDSAGNPRVLDFGLAKGPRTLAADEPTIQVLSQAGQILGTVAYMSPEQARGETDVDVRSDVYSLGVLFYEALLDQTPYSVTGPLGDILHNIVSAEPKSPRTVRDRSRFGSQINDELETILLKALEKERDRRYPTVGELGRDLRHLLAGEPIEAKRASTWYLLRKLLKRHKFAFTAAAAGFAGLLVFSATSMYLYEREKTARREADDARASMAEQAREARRAEVGEREARKEAQQSAQAALAAQHKLQRALAQQRIERGNLARERGGLTQARDSYWEAWLDQRGPAAHWALRQYYVVSGDDGAQLLSPRIEGPVAIAPEQQLAAAIESDHAITVRDLKTGSMQAWLPTPSNPGSVSISPNGRIVSTGPGWVRVWQNNQPLPQVSLNLPTPDAPVNAHVSADGSIVFVLTLRALNVFDARSGQLLHAAGLDADVSAAGVIAPQRPQLAIPTEAGLLLADWTDGNLGLSRVWTAVNAAVQGVRYVGETHLAFLADMVYLSALEDGHPTRWTTVHTSGRWDLFDVAAGGTLVAVGKRSGEVALYERGSQSGAWRTTLEGLECIWLDYSRKSVLGLDASGGVTAWVRREQNENVRNIQNASVQTWASAADGSTVVWIDDENRAVIYSPSRLEMPRLLPLSRFWSFAQIIPSETPALAASGNGARIVIRTGNMLRLLALDDGGSQFTQRAFSHTAEPLDHIALDHDGRLLALHSRSVEGDRHWIGFHRWEDQSQIPASEYRAGLDNLPVLGARYTFTGSQIIEMAFVPKSSMLLVARSNGELILVDPQAGGRLPDTPPGQPVMGALPPSPWITLDSPARRLAFDRSGKYLAAWCDDGVLRIIAMASGNVETRIMTGELGPSVAFDASGDSVVVRYDGGAVTIFERSSGEQIAGFRAPVLSGENALAAWVGPDDRLLLSSNRRVLEYRYQAIDRLIDANVAYARRRTIAKLIATEAYDAAWEALHELGAIDPAGYESDVAALVETLLQRRGMPASAACLAAVRAERNPHRLLQFGNAAYEGDKFDLAADLLRAAQAAIPDALDAGSLRRLAECSYLKEQYDEAAIILRQIAGSPDLAPEEHPTLELERIASLVLSGRHEEAKSLTLNLSAKESEGPAAIAARAARNIADFLVGTNSETVFTATVEQFLRMFGTQWLSYQDDAYFFRGELARAQGQLLFASAQYQRCIDQASDTWPANWARYRLLQMTQRPTTQ